MTRKTKTLEDLLAAPTAPAEDELTIPGIPATEILYGPGQDVDEAFEEARQEVLDGNSSDAAVIEFYGDNLDELTAKVKTAVDRLGEGAALYLSLPRTLGKEARGKLSDLIGETFARYGTLNVGTSPYLRNTDVNMRWGYVCIK